MSTTNPPPGAPIPPEQAPGAGRQWPHDATNLSAPDDSGGGGGVDPAALRAGHEPDVFEVKPILSIPFAVVVTFVIAFGVAAGVFAYVMAKGRETDPRAHPEGLARGRVSVNERISRISQKGSTTIPPEVDQPRLEPLKRLDLSDTPQQMQITTGIEKPGGNPPWVHPEELLPGRYAGLQKAEYVGADRKHARIPIDVAMRLLIEQKQLKAAEKGARPLGWVDQPTEGNAGRGGLPKAPEPKAAPKEAAPKEAAPKEAAPKALEAPMPKAPEAPKK